MSNVNFSVVLWQNNGLYNAEEYTVPFKKTRFFVILWYKVGVIHMDIMSFKRAPIFLSFWLQIDIDWIIKGDFIIQTPSSNGSKVMGCQSWRSKKFSQVT